MGSTTINVGAIIGLSSQVQKAKSSVSSVRSSFVSTKNQIDSRIISRNNYLNRFNSLVSQLATIENRIVSIKNAVENGANQYHNTDMKVRAWNSTFSGNLSSFGSIGLGLGILNGSVLGKQVSSKTEVDQKEAEDSTFMKVLKDDWKIEGAVIGGSSTKTGTILGFNSSGTAEGNLIGGSIKIKSKAKWSPEKGDAGIEKSIEVEGHLAKGKLEGNIGYFGGSVSGTVGAVGATGKVGATLFKDKKFSPSLEAKLKAEAAVAKGEAEVKAGSDDFNAHGKASGTLLGAEAEASGNLGVITYKDATTGQTKTEIGAKGKVGAEAYVAQGKVSGGITLFGIKIDAGIQGKAGGAGVSAEGRATTGGVSGKIGAGLGLGLGLEISIDWSGFSLW